MDTVSLGSEDQSAGARRSPLLHNLLLFSRLLRSLGIRTTSSQVVELATALGTINIGNKADFKNTARALLVNRHTDIPTFDRAFDAFWMVWTEAGGDPLSAHVIRQAEEKARQGEGESDGQARSPRSNKTFMSRLGGEGESDDDPIEGVVGLYSPGEMLRDKDFALLSPDEVNQAKRFLTQMQWIVTHRRALRQGPARRGRKLDVRRSLQRSMRYGGELFDLAALGPKVKRRRLVLLCDISGSMERYTRLLLHFLHSVEASEQPTEVFVFGTRLTRITPELRRRNPDAALAAVAGQVHDWSGGTRIGEALRIFNRRWSRRVLGQGAIVVIISDGWDRGSPQLLDAEMARLQRSSYRLIWLNPLLGSPNYQPLTQGIQAALPYVDDFLPVHNLQSLEALGEILNRVQRGRPPRKQAKSRV